MRDSTPVPSTPRSLSSDTPSVQPAGRISGDIRRVEDLSAEERRQMLALLSQYFENVSEVTFERDLAEKEWCVLLRSANGDVAGFSTLAMWRRTIEGIPVAAVYSGDTIVDRRFWGESALSRLWSRQAFALAGEACREQPGTRAYWFLISSGYKTYRFLPTFFRKFYPTFERPTPPWEARVMRTLAAARFPDEYDPAAGVVRPLSAAPLRSGVAELTPRRLTDPHVAFFARANPDHARGDELVCLTGLLPENLTPAGRRMLGL